MVKRILSIVAALISFGLTACMAPSSDVSPGIVSTVPEKSVVIREGKNSGKSELETPTTAPQRIELPDMGPAPEISNEVWINTDAPLSVESERGKVVLIEFWTYG